MNQDKDKSQLDQSTTTLIGHICIRDPDTGEIIVRQRDGAEKSDDQ